MKIAVLGKGGSGKSTISWLLTNYLASQGSKVLAIDADHNMDLVSCLGISETLEEKSFHKSIDEVREILQLGHNEHWSYQFHNGREIHWEEEYYPASEFLSKYLISASDNIDLLNLGLGDEDVMFMGKCTHGLSAPLKFYLPRLKLRKNSFVIIDSVAGADMVNYGLYFGCDIVCTVIENYTNSIRVAKQLHSLFKKQGISLKFIINKYDGREDLLKDFKVEFTNDIMGVIPVDIAVTKYDFNKLNQTSLIELSKLYQSIVDQQIKTDGYEMLKNFELKRKSAILSKV